MLSRNNQNGTSTGSRPKSGTSTNSAGKQGNNGNTSQNFHAKGRGSSQKAPNNRRQKTQTQETQTGTNFLDSPLSRGAVSAVVDGPSQNFTTNEVAQVGAVFEDPSKLGFMKSQQKKKSRATPRYMLSQPRLLVTPPFHQDPWDFENQAKMTDIEAKNNGSDYQGIYEEFQKMREVERKKMEELGLVDAENTRKDLNDAIYFQGTCLDMCPVFERTRRALENNVKTLEKDPKTNKISRERAVKAFSRPAAGQPPPMPSDVRPPHVLMKTLDYIVDNFVDQLPEAHSFIWDRTRSIRQDFIYQNFYGLEAIDCNERIVRIHLVSLHVMAGSDVEYSQQQELEQFNKALQTLTEIYQDVRNNGGQCPNEAEFRAYHLISHFRDPELEREIQGLPDHIFRDHHVQLALRFRYLMAQKNVVERGYTNTIGPMDLFVEFFRLAFSEETSFLLACLLETHFNEIRFYALKSMSRSYHTKGKPMIATALQKMLGFDTIDQLISFVSYYEVDIINDNGTVLVDLFNKEKLESKYKLSSLNDKPKLSQAFSNQLNYKMRGTLKSFINSGKSNENLNLKNAPGLEVLQSNSRKPSSIKSQVPSFVPSNANGPLTGHSVTSAFAANNLQSSVQLENGKSLGFGQKEGFSQQPISNTLKEPSISNEQKSGTSFNISDFLSNQNTSLGFSSTDSKTMLLKPNEHPNEATRLNKSNLSFQTPKMSDKSLRSKGKEEEPSQSFLMDQNNFSPTITPSVSRSLKTPFFLNPKKEQHKPSIANTNEFTGLAAPPKQNRMKSTDSPTLLINPNPPAQTIANKIDTKGIAEQIYGQIENSVLDEELAKLLGRLIKHRNRLEERNQIIESFTSELYSAFVSELTHQSTLTILADEYCKRITLKHAFSNWQKRLSEKMARKEAKKRRLQELRSIEFSRPTLKRRSLTPDINQPFTKRSSPSLSQNTSFEYMQEKQNKISKLWQPLNVKKFVDLLSHGFENHFNKEKEILKCLFIVEDWSSPYSKWLNTKFSLKLSDDRTHYSNRVESEHFGMDFESLPKNPRLLENSIRNVCLIVFECGMVTPSAPYRSTEEKLIRDSKTFQKLVQICDRYCLFKVQFLVLFWDTCKSNLRKEKVEEILKVKEITDADNSVENICICDMSNVNTNVAETLDVGFQRLCQNFTATLTTRGGKFRMKQLQLRRERMGDDNDLSVQPEVSRTISSHLKTKEEELARKGRELEKRKYLAKHIVTGNSDHIDLSNASFNNSVFKTPNGSFLNNSVINLNTSFFKNNTTLPHRDNSYFGSFANGSILEESTPFASPGPKFTKPLLPKKVQELKELSAAIKAKYRK